MNKLLEKVAKLTLGLSMAAGIGVAVASNREASKIDAATEYESLYTCDFTSVSTHSYTMNKTFTLNQKGWTASVSQVNGGIFYLGCNSNNSSKGVLAGTGASNPNNAGFWDDVVSAWSANDSKYIASGQAYALMFDNSYSNVAKVNFSWSGGNNAFQVFVFGDSGSGFAEIAKTNYATSGATTSGSAEWSGTATNYTRFAIVARPGTTSSTTTNKTLRPASFTIYKEKAASKTLSSITVTDNSQKTWQAGDTVSNTDLRIVATYSSGDPATITNGSGVYFDSNHTQTSSSALVQGSNTITVYYTDSYGSASNTVTISAIAPLVLDTIAVETAPTKTDYIENENFDPTGLVIRRNYEGGTHDTYTYANHTSEFSFNPSTSTSLTTSDTSVTITYGGKTTTQAITVDVQHGTESNPYTVSEARAAIDAGTGLTNAYTRGIVYQVDSYNSTYHSITYWISDDGTSTNPLEVYSGKGISGADFSSIDDIKVNDIVTVKGTLKKYNSTYEYDYNNELVTLVRKELSSITVSGQTTSYYVGDTFSFDGTVTAHYNDSSTKTVTATSVSSPDMSSSGNKSVTVTYEEGGISKTANYSITVNARTLSSISVDTPPTKTTYAAGECFDPTDLVITTVWNVGSNGSVAYNDHSSDFSFLPTLETELKKTDTSVTITYGGKSTTQAITVSEVDRYQLIKSASDLVSGATYLIGGSGDDSGYFISNNQASNNRTATTGTVTSEIVNLTSSMQVITLGGSTGAWTLYATGGSNEGYLYTATTGSNRLHTRASDSDDNSKWAITVSDAGVATIHNVGNTSRGQMAYNANSGSPIFACYSSGGNLSIYKLIDSSESVTISKSSVSGLKTDTDNTVSITANNFTPEDIEVSYSVANVAAVTKGTIENGVIPLNVAFTGIGTTVATITVTGGESDYDAELTITVAAKPDSLVVSGNGITLVDGGQTVANRRLEIQTGAEKQFSASHFTMLDTDENNMSATANDVTLSRTSGDDVVTFNGAKISAGSTPGSCVVRFASKLVSSVYYEITVNVVADYNVSVNSITYNDDLVDDQGHTLDISAIFKTKVANTHFNSTAPILDSELKFSYDDNDYANAVSADSFVYDFAHGSTSTAFGEGYKDQTVFVYTTFTESRVSSFEITIAQADNPLISISLDTGNSYNLQRNTTHQLVVSYNPSDTTDNRDVVYSLSNPSTGSTITVSSTGLISAGSKVGSVATITATVDPDQNPETENSVSSSVVVTVTRETMTLTADMPASYVKVTSTADLTSGKYLIVSEASNVVLTEAVNSTANKTTYENIDSSLDSYCFTYNASTGSLKGPNGSYIGKTASGNGMDVGSTEYTHTITFSDGDAVITASGGSILRYNTSWGGFRYYGSGQQAVQLYKQNGGETEVTVTDALFTVVDAAMTGSNGVYGLNLCDVSGSSFNVSAWNTLGNSFTSSIISDNKLAYARADENGNEIEQFLAVYDYVIGKKESGYAAYASANDYLGRVESGKISASPKVNLLTNIIGENTNTVAIIVIISMVSMTAIGGYFFLRKRKEN